MSFLPCQFHGVRVNGKLATIYANWFEAEDVRVAWRVRSCVDCLTRLMGELRAGLSQQSQTPTACVKCMKDASENPSGVFLTIYPPKQESREYVLNMCSSCGAEWRKLFTESGESLPDRSAVAAATAQQSKTEWDTVPW